MSIDIRDFHDVHTHRRDASGAVISIDPTDDMRPELYYSVGVHPWLQLTDHEYATRLQHLAALASHPQVVAIGETGLDALRGDAIDRQQQVFESHVRISETMRKPLIIHAVRTFDRLLQLRRRLRPEQLWIIHGFRGRPELARQLLAAGFALSYGEHFNPASVAVTPIDRLFTETDESSLPIGDIRSRVIAAAQSSARSAGS